MARKSTKNTAIEEAAATNEVVAAEVSEAVEDKNLDAVTVSSEEENKKTRKRTVTRNSVEIDNGEEIEVVSLLPHVSYLDKKTQDMYEWDEVGHVEYMTFETLKDMWRNNKGYFRNLWLKPMDERVIIKFGLTRIFENYDFIMDENNYKRGNEEKLLKAISNASNEMRFTICNKIKSMIVNGTLSDIMIIRALENKLDSDFVSLI